MGLLNRNPYTIDNSKFGLKFKDKLGDKGRGEVYRISLKIRSQERRLRLELSRGEVEPGWLSHLKSSLVILGTIQILRYQDFDLHEPRSTIL